MQVALPNTWVQQIIGFVVHDGALLLNVSGPAEVFATATGIDFYRSVVFSTRGGGVRMSCGLEITSAPLSHPDLAAIDALLVVGGRGVESAVSDPSLRVWLRSVSSRIATIAAWIDEHYAKPLATEKLASMAAMSERNFARRFRAETGMSAHVYLERLRAAAAHQLMSDSDLPLDKIALRVGLHDAQRMRREVLRTESSA